MGKRILLYGLIFAVSCAMLPGVRKVPLTGRSQLNLIDEQEINALSFKEYQKVLGESKVLTGGPQAAMVQKVGLRIQRAVETYFREQNNADYLTHYRWEFNLIDDSKTANAWCMPGGKVAFYTGILPITADEAGLAVVMGHEIAHAIANHGNERMSQTLAMQKISGGIAGVISNDPEKASQIFMGALGIGVLLPFSRSNESEADYMGLMFMSMAGYNPEHAPLFWERMLKYTNGGGTPQFLSTHPSHETRIANLKKWLPEARKYYRPGGS